MRGENRAPQVTLPTKFPHTGDEGLRSSAFIPRPNKAPIDMLGLEESDTGAGGRVEEVMDEARNIWRDM